MKPCRYCVVLIFILIGMANANPPGQAASGGRPASSLPPISRQTRLDLIRTFDSELVYIRTVFPMGKKGLTLKDGVLSPTGAELQGMIATWGPSVKPGDQARISAINIKGDRIHFEINGGPVKKEKWYQRIQVGGAAGTAPIAPSDSNANPRGSYVDLVFDHYVPDLNPQQLKQLLHPVFNFDAQSARDAYLETVPPKAKDAIKNHQVLVGMNREMVMYAKGRPPKKVRERQGETEYEDWIYGEPPEDVDFVRFVGDEVVRVEIMKVSGEKIVRTTKEIELAPTPSVAKASQTERPANAPTLRRPGEELPNDSSKNVSDQPTPMPPPPPPSDAPPAPNFLE
jgi:hypothetical protein